MLPKITVNGEPVTNADYIAISGGVLILVGLCMAGLPWACIGLGTVAIATSRLKWVSSTDSPSEQAGSPRPTQTDR